MVSFVIVCAVMGGCAVMGMCGCAVMGMCGCAMMGMCGCTVMGMCGCAVMGMCGCAVMEVSAVVEVCIYSMELCSPAAVPSTHTTQ